MSTTTTDPVRTADAKRVSEWRPIYIDDCFGPLHVPVETRGVSEGKVTVHPSLRLLAEALAAVRRPSLRRGHSGTGGFRAIGTAEPSTTWRRSIHVAADWLPERRRTSLVSKVRRQRACLNASLCGPP